MGRGHGNVREMTHVKITHTRKHCFSSDAVGQTDFDKKNKKKTEQKPTRKAVVPKRDLKRHERRPDMKGLFTPGQTFQT